MKIADSVTLDWNDGVTIDGIEFPFYVSEDVEIESGPGLITTVRLGLFVDGVLTIRDHNGKRKVYDGREGDVAEWAKRLVREGLIERIPDLTLPEADA